MKNGGKIIFALVVVVVAFFSRAAYPTLSAFPTLSAANQVETTAGKTDPPLIILPSLGTTSSVASVNANSGIPPTHTSEGPAPSLSVEASLVADPASGAIFSSFNPDVRWPTASLTKWMTATIILDTLSTSTRITITPEMFSADPDELTLKVGGTYTIEDLLHVMLMPSSNVAAEAMADFYGRAAFMQAMNARAAAWGMTNTYFDDPSGISAANESTASDLMILAEHVYKDYPDILSITRTPQVYITELNSEKQVLVKSINEFAGEPDFLGGKTGHTDQASGNLLSIFEYGGNPVLIIVLGTADRFDDSVKLYTWYKANYP